MDKFHLTSKGPMPCNARKKSCPLGGEHFSSREEAEKAFEAHLGATFTGLNKKQALPPQTIEVKVTPQAGGRYYGCHVGKKSLEPYLTAWRNEIGAEKAAMMEELKAQRDRGYVYHLTLITPPETRALKANTLNFPNTAPVTYKGIGFATDGTNEAWFIVCESEPLQQWRKNNNLPPKDFHITLGFSPKDVHAESKGLDSIRLS